LFLFKIEAREILQKVVNNNFNLKYIYYILLRISNYGGIRMKYFKSFLTLACLTTLLFLPVHSFAAEESSLELLQAENLELNQEVKGDLFAQTNNNVSKNGTYKNQWKPYLAPLFLNSCPKHSYLQVNVGFGLLRFSGLKGGFNRSGIPVSIETNSFEGRLAYSRTPLVEMILGCQYNTWFQAGLSYQHQGDIDVQSIPQMLPAAEGIFMNIGQFKSSLRLDAFAVKVYFNTAKAMIMKGIAYSAYMGLGTGPSWQSWTNMTIDAMDFIGSSISSAVSTTLTDNFSFKNRYCANWFFMVDPGFKLQSVIPSKNVSVLLGCKFNYWGQARNLGHSQGMKNWFTGGLAHPIGIKSIYQFAPYFGFELDF